MVRGNVQLSYSIGSKLKSAIENPEAKKVPGPGNYTVEKDFKYRYRGHTKFGKGARRGIYNENHAKFVPAPDNYSPDDSPRRKRSPDFSFGTAK